jgi:DNA-binding GntR family transcriptional regulator
MEFHRSIILFMENPRILEIYENVLNQSHGLFLSEAVKAAFSWGEKLEVNTSGHQRILSAIKERNAQKAQQEIIAHIKRGCQFAIMIVHAQSILKPDVSQKAS